jgi:hypothetical protein
MSASVKLKDLYKNTIYGKKTYKPPDMKMDPIHIRIQDHVILNQKKIQDTIELQVQHISTGNTFEITISCNKIESTADDIKDMKILEEYNEKRKLYSSDVIYNQQIINSVDIRITKINDELNLVKKIYKKIRDSKILDNLNYNKYNAHFKSNITLNFINNKKKKKSHSIILVNTLLLDDYESNTQLDLECERDKSKIQSLHKEKNYKLYFFHITARILEYIEYLEKCIENVNNNPVLVENDYWLYTDIIPNTVLNFNDKNDLHYTLDEDDFSKFNDIIFVRDRYLMALNKLNIDDTLILKNCTAFVLCKSKHDNKWNIFSTSEDFLNLESDDNTKYVEYIKNNYVEDSSIIV